MLFTQSSCILCYSYSFFSGIFVCQPSKTIVNSTAFHSLIIFHASRNWRAPKKTDSMKLSFSRTQKNCQPFESCHGKVTSVIHMTDFKKRGQWGKNWYKDFFSGIKQKGCQMNRNKVYSCGIIILTKEKKTKTSLNFDFHTAQDQKNSKEEAEKVFNWS